MNWISVKTGEYPTFGTPVDLWCKWKMGDPSRVADATLEKDSMGAFWRASMGHVDDSVVTHWSYLPEPPNDPS